MFALVAHSFVDLPYVRFTYESPELGNDRTLSQRHFSVAASDVRNKTEIKEQNSVSCATLDTFPDGVSR